MDSVCYYDNLYLYYEIVIFDDFDTEGNVSGLDEENDVFLFSFPALSEEFHDPSPLALLYVSSPIPVEYVLPRAHAPLARVFVVQSIPPELQKTTIVRKAISSTIPA